MNGQACEQTLCPGYSAATGLSCNGRGTCSPLVQPLPECAGGGWESAQCAAAVARLDAANISQAVSIPQCMCTPPWSGPDCRVNMCPEDVSLDICSGNGNTSVGYTRNGTGAGNGW